jgi:hypothetical protein
MDTEFDELQVTFVPLVKVHVKVLMPKGMPDTVVLLVDGLAIVEPAPPVHKPVSPAPAAFACKVPLPVQTSDAGVEGFDTVGVLFVTTTISDAEHAPFTTVHVNEYTPPVKPLTPLAGLVELAIVTGEPPVQVHEPVPMVGAVALKLIPVAQVSISTPALEVTPLLLTVISS